MKARTLWIIGVFLFILLVIANTPAKIMVSFMPTIKGLEISGVNGSIWSGTAASIQYKGIDFGEGNWEISPWSLLLLSVTTEIHTKQNKNKIDANLSFSLGGISSDSIKAHIPANWLPKLSGKRFESEGTLLLRIIHLEKDSDSPIKLTGTLAWQDASIKTAFSRNASQLGNLQVDVSTQDETLVLDLKDSKGPLGLKADIQFTPPNNVVIKGSVNENLPPELASFFQFFAKPDNKGRLIINYSGIVPGL